MNNPFETIDKRLSNIENLLLDLKHAPKELIQIPQPPEYLTRKEVANRLHITLATLNEYTKSGKIIGNRIGNRVLYKESDIQQSLTKMKTL